MSTASQDPDFGVRLRWLLSRVAIYGTLAVFAAVYLLPSLVIVASSFRTSRDVAANGLISFPESFSFAPYIRAWTSICVSGICEGIAPNFFNSLRITLPATLISTALGALNGYILSKWRFRGSGIIFTMILLGVFVSPQVTLLPWAWIMGQLGLANSATGLILIHSVQGIAFTTLFCRNFYVTLPDQLIQAARVDGAGFWRIFHRVVLPLSPPILIVAIIWQFTGIWNEYLYGMVFTSGTEQPITVALMSAGTGSQSASVIIAALPPLLIYLLGGRYFVRGLTHGSMR